MKKEAKKENKAVLTMKNLRFSSLKARFTSVKNSVFHQIDKRPLGSFFVLLALLVSIIVVGNILRRPPSTKEEEKKEPTKVEIFSIGKAPRMAFSGIVDKSGVVTIVAQSPGIVNYINVTEGTRVLRGQTLLGLSTNYVGGSIASISRQIAQQNVNLSEQTYPIQLEMIKKRREIAEKSDSQADQLRDIASQSINDTKAQISLNEQILSSLDGQINELEQTNVGGANDALILQAKQGKSGVLSGLNALRSALRSTEYQTSGDEEPANLSDLGREVTLKQLEIEEKALSLSKEIAGLNLKIAQISESLYYPASPESAVVEKVFVSYGQSVNPGTPLVTLTMDKNVSNLRVPISSDLAKQISRIEKSTVFIQGQQVELLPRYISTEPTDGALHSAVFTIPKEYGELLTDGSSIKVEMPIGHAKSTVSVPYVPIDAVFQTQTTAVIYVASPSAENTYTAYGKEVTLGSVFGSFVQITKGLLSDDQVILNRGVLSGDSVSF